MKKNIFGNRSWQEQIPWLRRRRAWSYPAEALSSLFLTDREQLSGVCAQGREEPSECVQERQIAEIQREEFGMQRERGREREENWEKQYDHLSRSRCASCCGWVTAGVRRARLLRRNLTRPRKSSAAYSTQRAGLIASLRVSCHQRATPQPLRGATATWGGSLPSFLCLLLLWSAARTAEAAVKNSSLRLRGCRWQNT